MSIGEIRLDVEGGRSEAEAVSLGRAAEVDVRKLPVGGTGGRKGGAAERFALGSFDHGF